MKDFLFARGVGGWLHRENHVGPSGARPGKARCMPGACRSRGTVLGWVESTVCLERGIAQQRATDRLRGNLAAKRCCARPD
jgi:hypothetical protein